MKQIEDSVMLIPSAKMQTRSNDTEYVFRQDSNFYYLTGFNEPEALLLICKNRKKSKTILFLREKNPEMEMWLGRFLGVKDAVKTLGVDEAYDIKELKEKLPKILENHTNLHVDNFNDNIYVNIVKNVCKELKNPRTVNISPTNFLHVDSILENMRLIKEPFEINEIKKALKITAKAHHATMAMKASGKKEYEVQALIEYIFKKEGASYDAYTSIVAGGNNANTLHYIENSKELKDGELMLIDAGCEWNLYASDITRTTPINGKFSEPQKEIYNKILEAQEKIIKAIKPKMTKQKLQKLSEKLLTQVMLDLKILKGSLKQNLKDKKFKKYYPHGIGHWMGLDVHDTCPYKDSEGKDILFQEGMVLTVEPAIYLPLDDKKVPKRFRGIGIRIEDDILVTKDGYENLSKDIAKSVDEIESTCRKDYNSFI